MSFRDDMLADIDAVFLDLEAFAELQELAGKSIPVVSEYLEVDSPEDAEQRPGVRYEGVTLYVSLREIHLYRERS